MLANLLGKVPTAVKEVLNGSFLKSWRWAERLGRGDHLVSLPETLPKGVLE